MCLIIISLLVFIKSQISENERLRNVKATLSKEIMQLTERSNRLEEQTKLEAQRATKSIAQTTFMMQELKKLESQLDSCR